jgi:peroxiredoxin
MKSKLLIILVFSFIYVGTVYCQNQQIGKSYTRSFIDKDWDISKLYNKVTGTRVTEGEFHKIRQENPKMYIEREIDEEGNVIRYLYDPNKPAVNDKPNLMTNIPERGLVPNFKVKTIDGKKIELASLQGKLVILRFECGAGDFRFKKNEIAELDKKINALKNKENVEAIIIFECSEEEVRKGFDLQNSNFNLIADGRNFSFKYGVHFYPSTLLIDQSGKLINVYFNSEDINLEEYLN